jgi:hypothetical protein
MAPRRHCGASWHLTNISLMVDIEWCVLKPIKREKQENYEQKLTITSLLREFRCESRCGEYLHVSSTFEKAYNPIERAPCVIGYLIGRA